MRQIAIVLIALTTTVSAATIDCANGPSPAAGGLGYKASTEGDRCEGEIRQLNAYHGLELVGFTAGKLMIHPDPTKSVQLSWQPAQAKITIRASSTTEDLYYQMDHFAAPGERSFLWKLDRLWAATHEDGAVTLAGFTGSMGSEEFYPVENSPTFSPVDALVLHFRTNVDGVSRLRFEGCTANSASLVQPASREGPFTEREVIDVTLPRRSGLQCLKVIEAFDGHGDQSKNFQLRVP